MSKLFGFMNTQDQSRFTDIGLLILRVTTGLTMVYAHGFQKLTKLMGDQPIRFADPIGIGELPGFYLTTFAEFVCASLIILGLFTRWATVPLIIAMFVAVFLVNWPKPFTEGETAFLYLSACVVIFLLGPGKYALDAKLVGK